MLPDNATDQVRYIYIYIYIYVYLYARKCAHTRTWKGGGTKGQWDKGAERRRGGGTGGREDRNKIMLGIFISCTLVHPCSSAG